MSRGFQQEPQGNRVGWQACESSALSMSSVMMFVPSLSARSARSLDSGLGRRVVVLGSQCLGRPRKRSLRCRSTEVLRAKTCDINEGDGSQESEQQEAGDLASASHTLVLDSFLPELLAENLRSEFDDVFSEPRSLHAKRFVWDYWHVDQQYSHHRTPAAQFFSPQAYSELEDTLLEFGQRQLGCRAMTPIWLSFYVNGSRQELHADVPHGPWAFVVSLTRDSDLEAAFTGGETMILQPHVLDYWRGFSSSNVVELPSLLAMHTPKFNRIVAFDARVPHGVRVVEGTRDPMHSRIVLHGWFAEPAPFFEGALDEYQAADALQEALDVLFEQLAQLPVVVGVLSFRLHINGADGCVASVEGPLTDTLVARPQALERGEDPIGVRDAIWTVISSIMSQARFPPIDGSSREHQPFDRSTNRIGTSSDEHSRDSWITIPLVFDD